MSPLCSLLCLPRLLASAPGFELAPRCCLALFTHQLDEFKLLESVLRDGKGRKDFSHRRGRRT